MGRARVESPSVYVRRPFLDDRFAAGDRDCCAGKVARVFARKHDIHGCELARLTVTINDVEPRAPPDGHYTLTVKGEPTSKWKRDRYGWERLSSRLTYKDALDGDSP